MDDRTTFSRLSQHRARCEGRRVQFRIGVLCAMRLDRPFWIRKDDSVPRRNDLHFDPSRIDFDLYQYQFNYNYKFDDDRTVLVAKIPFRDPCRLDHGGHTRQHERCLCCL